MSTLFRPGWNTWQVAYAKRAAFLVDGDAFFRAFAESALQAERSIFILGWDTDSRTEIPHPEGQRPLGQFLAELVRDKPDLRVYVLSWDFAFIYLFEREALPSLKFGAIDSTERLRFVLDHEHPFWASHHQKIVVIDDVLAFSGGLDLTQRRWDTPEHKNFDARRVDPGGHCYGPFHDVQVCVEGAVATTLGSLARKRWRAATGENLPVAFRPSRSPWPESFPADITGVDVGISRTLPVEQKGRRPVHEVERLFLDMIRAADKCVYIENQYFTSMVLARAIAERLEEPEGPEFVLVLPRDQTGWIEESTMGLLRSEALRHVERADRHGRFRCFYPVVPGLDRGYVKVHSKVMIVDDRIVRIGSANMNSRSLGLDTECDLTIESGDRADVASVITRFRAKLLSEHLGCPRERFENKLIEIGSLAKTVDRLVGAERTLVPLHPTVPAWVSRVTPPKEWIDPKGPRGIRRWFLRRLRRTRSKIAITASLGLLLFAYFILQNESDVAASLRETGVASWDWLRSWDAESIAATLESFRGKPWAVPAVLLGFILGAAVFVPISALILGTMLAFPKALGIGLALSGCLASSCVLYAIGRYWAWSKSRFLNRPWLQKLADKFRRGGLGAVVVVRLMPIAPFAAVGFVAGGLRVPFRNFFFGTLIGLLPGIGAFGWFANRMMESSTHHASSNAVWIAIAAILFVLLAAKLPKYLGLRKARSI